MIAECRNLVMLRRSLATLPKTLDQTYDRILTAISEEDRIYTIRILQWLTYSARPLTLEEVAEVAAIDIAREPAFNRDEVLVDPLEALKICSSLVTTAKEGPSYDPRQIVLLAHYSVQEYLVSDRIRQGPAKQYSMEEIECHKAMTIGCLWYLNQFQEPLTYETDEIYYASALADYSAQFWSDHIQKTGDGEEEMSRLAMNLLLTNDPAFVNSIRIYNPDTDEFYGSRISEEKIGAPLYYASFLGLIPITRLLLGQDVDVNAQNGSWGTALLAAVVRDHLAVVKLLVHAKADVNVEIGDGCTALHEAMEQGEKAMIKALIDAGADVNKRDHRHRSALQKASSQGDEKVVRLLTKAGADVNAPDSENLGNALLLAAEGGHTAVVELLLDEGALINAQHSKWGSALHGAVRSSQEMTAEVLLKRGASVAPDLQPKGVMNHAVDSPGCTLSLVRLLQQYDVPLDSIDVDNMTPLHYCVKFEHEAIAKHLIDAGVPIDSKVRRRVWPSRVGKQREGQVNTSFLASTSITFGLTPLHFATLNGDTRMTKFLLEHGANPNALSEYAETPLHLALRATVLGEKSKDDWDTALAVTTQAREKVINALLADPRICLITLGDDDESFLHCVSYGKPGSATLIRMLVARGVDPCSINSSQQSPLHLAIQAGDAEAVKALLVMGANASLTNEFGINALHYAAQCKHSEVVVAVLESKQAKAGMLITSKDRIGQNVLHHILSRRSEGPAIQARTVQWLIDHGANGSELDNLGNSPLHVYIKSSTIVMNKEILSTLLEIKGNTSSLDQDGQTLGHLCARLFGFGLSILQTLNEHRVDLMRKDHDGRTVLHCAVMFGTLTEETLRFLVNVIGIGADERDSHGRTALQYTTEAIANKTRRFTWHSRSWEYTRNILSRLHDNRLDESNVNVLALRAV